MVELVRTVGGERLHMFTLRPGLCNLTSGTHTGVVAAHCVANGTITITFNGVADTEAVPCLAGEEYAFVGAKQVVVTSGTFHLM